MRRRKSKFLKAIGIAAVTVAVCVTPVIADEVSDLQDEKNKIESEVDDLESKLTEILTDLDDMEEKAAKLGEDIEHGRQDLAVAQQKQEDQYADMKLRVQYMYENNNANVADIFLASDSFAEALNKSEYVQQIYDYDRSELDELDKTTKEISTINARLAADLEELERQQEAALAKKDELDNLIESKRSEVSDLDSRIAAVQAEIARKAAEEEARRQAELAHQTQAVDNSDTNSSSSASDSDNATRSASAGNSAQSSSSGQTRQASNNNAGSSNNTNNNTNNNNNSNNQSSSSSGSGSSIVSTAYNYIGVPYVYGGSSPSGFDCSGLVQYVYRQNGISLPRTSGAQAGVGRGVSLSSAQPGDIVCYPGHVAIYIGGGKVIHAPYPGRRVEVANANMMTITTVRRVL